MWRPEVVYSGERMVPGKTDPGNVVYHVRRYQFAAELARGKRVLDAGCGIGYGSETLASVAESVVGVDYCADAVLFARDRYPRPNLRFAAADVTALCFPDASFDLVVSLEVFEHIPSAEAYLDETRRVLRPGGLFVMSTPNQGVDRIHMRAIQVECEYHVNLTGLARLRRMLGSRYQKVRLYGLRRKGNPVYSLLRGLDVFNLRLRLFPPERRDRANALLGVPSVHSVSPSDVAVSRWQVGQANHVIAVGVKPPCGC